MKLVGLAVKVKSPAVLTVRLTVVMWVKPPETPVIVTVEVPVAAVLVAANVSVLDATVLEGSGVAVTPLGSPLAVSATLPTKPFNGFTVIVLVPLVPCTTVRLVGLAESVKLGGGTVTVSDTTVVCVKLPEIPVTVTLYDPTATALLTVSVKVLLLVVLTGENAAVTPLGIPLADSATAPAKVPIGCTVIRLEPLPPWTAVALVELSEKSGIVRVALATAETLEPKLASPA